MSPGVLGDRIYREDWEEERLGEKKRHVWGEEEAWGEEEVLVAFGFLRELE